MNPHQSNPGTSAAANASPSSATADALQTRFAFQISAGLTERSRELGADLSERLRFAREKALERARAARVAEGSLPVGAAGAGAAVLGRLGSDWWLKFASVVPVFVLIAGLVLIERWQNDTQISVAAEVDAALLSDDLPPNAYSDAGFAEFLKTPNE